MDDLEGKVITSVNGNNYCLSSIIGQGAQGVIYNTSDNQYVVKLYKKESEINSRKKIKLVDELRLSRPIY